MHPPENGQTAENGKNAAARNWLKQPKTIKMQLPRKWPKRPKIIKMQPAPPNPLVVDVRCVLAWIDLEPNVHCFVQELHGYSDGETGKM